MTTYGSTPQINRSGITPGIKPLFHSVRDIALILDKTVKAGYGVLKVGTLMAINSADSKLIPYPQANANENLTNAKAYLADSLTDADTSLFVNIDESYKFAVGDSLILDGSGAGTTEIQSLAAATPWATGSIYILAHTASGTELTATMGATETLAGLVTLLLADPGYAAAPFTITAGTNALTLTWKTIGVQTLSTYVKDEGSTVTASRSTTGTDYDQDTIAAEDLGAITAIDRTARNSTLAKITFTTGVTTAANFTAIYSGCVYCKGGDSSTPFTKAEYILDKDIDTGVDVLAKGAITSVVVSNAVLYKANLVGYDSAAATDLGTSEDGRFVILK